MTTAHIDNEISSLEFFKINWTCWRLLGLKVPPKDSVKPLRNLNRFAYILWAIGVNLLASCISPIHFALGILQSRDELEQFDSISITITSIGAAVKLLMIAIKMKEIKRMEPVIQVLDSRVLHTVDRLYYQKDIRRNILQIQRLYSVLYFLVAVAAGGTFVFSKERRLFYAGWLPFDWRKSNQNYLAALAFQMFIIFFQFVQTFCNDSFSPKTLCVLSAHIKLLHKRVARIGNENGGNSKSSLDEQKNELDLCVLDQKNLYELQNIVQNIISWPMFLQIFVSVTNNCVALIALLFYATEIPQYMYYSIYIAAMFMQIFPTCYYGSVSVHLFDRLHYAAFSCNWIGQSKTFKRHMILFTERSLRQTKIMAGGMFPIHLDTFFATCKGTYSLISVILAMNN